MTDNVDPQLAAGLDERTYAVLRDWAQLHGRHYDLERWLVNGRSRQPVAVVVETDDRASTTQQLVLKVLRVGDDGVGGLEYARHRDALRQAGAFAAYLTEYVHEAIPVPGGQWITFQRIAGQTLSRHDVLTALLLRSLGIATDAGDGPPASGKPAVVVAACTNVVRGVLVNWAGPPYTPPGTRWSVSEFFHRHLFEQLEEGGRLHELSRRYPGTRVSVPGEPEPLPNPFAAARGELFDDAVVIRPLLGRSHGDLHTDNALVLIDPEVDPAAFHLIDTALYEELGPLTRDPVHLVLYVLTRTWETVTPADHGPLIELLLDPSRGSGQRLSAWLEMLIRLVDAEAVAWVRPSGLEDTWRAQTLLSLAACALLFLGRSSTPDSAKPFYLRLAARAVERFAGADSRARRSLSAAGTPRGEEAGTAADTRWIGWFCREYPDVRAAAERKGASAEVARFRDDALAGIDRSTDFQDFVRRLGGPELDNRFGTHGQEGQAQEESFTCPILRCSRREERPPGGGVPVCHLAGDQPQRMRSSLG